MPGNDPYARQIAELKRGALKRAVSTTERATFIVNRLAGWDSDTLGDWRDAVAVAARRQKVHSRNPTVLLAKILWGVDSKRAAEIGRMAEKFRTRVGARLVKEVGKAGGVKAVLKPGFAPAKRPLIRRKKPPALTT